MKAETFGGFTLQLAAKYCHSGLVSDLEAMVAKAPTTTAPHDTAP